MAENTVYDYESRRLIYEIRDAVESLKKRNAMLIAAQSKVDMEKCDIEHYIENGTFSASKGYEAAMMLKECMERRRAIKNELAIINETYTMIGGKINFGQVEGTIKRLERRTYHPRVRPELFEIKKPEETEA